MSPSRRSIFRLESSEAERRGGTFKNGFQSNLSPQLNSAQLHRQSAPPSVSVRDELSDCGNRNGRQLHSTSYLFLIREERVAVIGFYNTVPVSLDCVFPCNPSLLFPAGLLKAKHRYLLEISSWFLDA